MLTEADPILTGAALGAAILIQWVWMGLALGAVLKKLDAPALHAWIPVLRWVAAARVGRASTVTVAIARGVALCGALVAVGAVVASWVVDSLDADLLLIALLSGMLLWLAGSLTGWVLWIYGAGTVQMRMRAPRGLTWVAALWPLVWASVMGWGKYSALGARAGTGRPGQAGPVLSTGPNTPGSLPNNAVYAPNASVPGTHTPVAASAPPPTSAPRPASAQTQLPPPTGIAGSGEQETPGPARKSPFASLAPEVLRPDTAASPPPPGPFAPTTAASAPPAPTTPSPTPAPPTTSTPPAVPTPSHLPAPSAPPSAPASSAPPAPPTPPAPSQPPAPSAPTAPPPSEVSPYVSKLSPYLATPDDAVPSQLTPYGNPTPSSTSDSAPPPAPSAAVGPPSAPAPQQEPVAQQEPVSADSLGSWVERMRDVGTPEPEPATFPPVTASPPEHADASEPEPSPPLTVAPDPVAPMAAPEATEPSAEPSPPPPAPTPPAPTPPTPAPTPPPPAPTPLPPAPTSGSIAQPAGASAVLPVITEPPATPTQPTAPPVPAAEDDDDDENTVVVRRTPDSWTLKVGNASYSLAGPSVVIGRATATSRPGILGIADTTRTMSKRHAELIRRGDTWWVRDLGSTNGTYVRAADGDERRIDGTDSEIVDGGLVLGDLVTEIIKTEA